MVATVTTSPKWNVNRLQWINMVFLLDAEKGSFLWSQRSYSERRFFRYPTIAPGTSTKLSPVHQVFHFIVLVNYGEHVMIPNSGFKIKGLQ